MRITQIDVALYTVPSQRTRVSLTEPRANTPPEVLVVQVHTEGPHVGLGFAPAAAGGRALRALVEHDLAPGVVGESALEVDKLLTKSQARFRGTGFPGLAARGHAAIDIALWDLKAKSANLPLWRFWGGSRSASPAFLADVATLGADTGQALKAARPLLEKGAMGVAVEVGSGDVQQDADRVQQVRDAVGESAWLGVSVDGRYDLGTALALAHFYEDDVGIDWIDFPIAADDRIGYQRLAERMEVSLAIGSSFNERADFKRTLDLGLVRVLRPDLYRLGGLTPLLKVAALAEAHPVTVVPYRCPELSAHLACGLPNVPMLEWGSWLGNMFATGPQWKDGKVAPPDAPGHGLELNSTALKNRIE